MVYIRPCRDLNLGPHQYQADMLPTKLSWNILNSKKFQSNGRLGIQTAEILQFEANALPQRRHHEWLIKIKKKIKHQGVFSKPEKLYPGNNPHHPHHHDGNVEVVLASKIEAVSISEDVWVGSDDRNNRSEQNHRWRHCRQCFFRRHHLKNI